MGSEIPDSFELPSDPWDWALTKRQLQSEAIGNILDLPPVSDYRNRSIWLYLFWCYLFLDSEGRFSYDSNPRVEILEEIYQKQYEVSLTADRQNPTDENAEEDYHDLENSDYWAEFFALEDWDSSAELEEYDFFREQITLRYPGLRFRSVLLLWELSFSAIEYFPPFSKVIGAAETAGFRGRTNATPVDEESAAYLLMDLSRNLDLWRYPDVREGLLDAQARLSALFEFADLDDLSKKSSLTNHRGKPWPWTSRKAMLQPELESFFANICYLGGLGLTLSKVSPVLVVKLLDFIFNSIARESLETSGKIRQAYSIGNGKSEFLSGYMRDCCKGYVLANVHKLKVGQILKVLTKEGESSRWSEPKAYNQSKFEFKKEIIEPLNKLAVIDIYSATIENFLSPYDTLKRLRSINTIRRLFHPYQEEQSSDT